MWRKYWPVMIQLSDETLCKRGMGRMSKLFKSANFSN